MIAPMYVEIRERQADGSEHTVATFRCEGRVVTCDNPVLWNHLMQASGGVIVGERGRRFYPQNGESYLENLRFQYRGPYLFAMVIGSPESPEPLVAASTTLPPEPAVVVEIPEDPGECQAAQDRWLFLLSVFWGAAEFSSAHEALETVARLLEAECGLSTREVFADEDLRMRLQRARHGVTPPPVVPRLAEKVERYWQGLVTSLRRGDRPRALVQARLMGEVLRNLQDHLPQWLQENGLVVLPEREAVGVRAGEAESSWEELRWDPATGDAASIDVDPTGPMPPGIDPVGFLDRASRRAFRAIQRAVECAPRGELHTAMITLRQAVSYEPARNEARTLLGEVLLRIDHPRAESELHKALLVETLRRGPNALLDAKVGSYLRQIRVHQALARCALFEGRVLEARGHLERGRRAFDELELIGAQDGASGFSEDDVRALADGLDRVLTNLSRDGIGSPPARGRVTPASRARDSSLDPDGSAG